MLVDIDHPKQRLISRIQIARAILELTESGIPVDQWLATLTRSFYVDLDTYNEVMGYPPTVIDRQQLDS